MARPKKDQAPDLAQACELTAGAIERLACPPGKAQAFLRDLKAPALRVRVTAAGAKALVASAGGIVKAERTPIGPEMGWYGEFADPSGVTIGLHTSVPAVTRQLPKKLRPFITVTPAPVKPERAVNPLKCNSGNSMRRLRTSASIWRELTICMTLPQKN